MNHELQNIIETMQHPTPTTCELHGFVVHIAFEDDHFILKYGDRFFAEIYQVGGSLSDFNDNVIPRPAMWRIVADFVEALQA